MTFFFIFFYNTLSSADTIQVFTLPELYEHIHRYHPVVRQAELLPQQAQQEVRLARGAFDPYLNSYFDQKAFKSQEYYSKWNSLVKIPLWFGTDLKLGYEHNTGTYLNPENKTDTGGQTYAGISLPIGQGWLMDQRRATIRQAQAFTQVAEADKIKILNKLLLEATKDYWEWAFAYQKWLLYTHAYDLAVVRYRGVRERAAQGDLAAIDTVEARIEVNNRKLLHQQAWTDYQNGRLILSNYLWQEGQPPVELVTAATPLLPDALHRPVTPDSLQQLVQFARQQHPEILKLQAKLRQLEIEKRLAADKFKPKLTLDYNFLRSNFDFPVESFSSNSLLNNYKLGVSFQYPLLLRAERGKFKLSKLKPTDNALDLQQTTRNLETSLQTTYNELTLLESQIKTQEQLAQQAEILRNGEQIRFENGESSLFLINTREMNLVNYRLKLWELKIKYAKTHASLYWAAGMQP
ncbi:TolC family protein [Adhaeribacter pallidiroseus]|uniref:TolC family protein n=1 Tax=Adhaeribacter pallidiroseus TaxID=2072847 RepID=UPI0013143834|nr:TolC family protein [Adhaeribacter pallidiroseus]